MGAILGFRVRYGKTPPSGDVGVELVRLATAGSAERGAAMGASARLWAFVAGAEVLGAF